MTSGGVLREAKALLALGDDEHAGRLARRDAERGILHAAAPGRRKPKALHGVQVYLWVRLALVELLARDELLEAVVDAALAKRLVDEAHGSRGGQGHAHAGGAQGIERLGATPGFMIWP